MTSSIRANRPVPARALLLAVVLVGLLIGGACRIALAETPDGAAPASTHAVAAPRPVPTQAAVHRVVRAAPKPRSTPHARHHRHHHARPASAPVTTVTAAAAPAPVTTSTHHHRHHTATSSTTTVHHASGPTDWAELNQAIARIPTYHAGAARWVIQPGSHWGTADWYTDVIYVTRSIPVTDLYSVAAHEWSHLLSVADYDGDVTAAVNAMHSYFGGAGLLGAERAADCMAILQGATWTAYTSCTDPDWRAGARRLLNGKKLRT